jgi:flagellar basal body rod protein FlgB
MQTSETTGFTGDAVDTNNHNVSVDGETLTAIDTQLRYQLATESMNNKFRILHSAIGSH